MIYTNYKATELKSVNLLHFVEQNSKLLDCTGILFEVSCSRGAFLSLKTKQISRRPWRCYLKYFMQWREKLVQDSLSRIVLCPTCEAFPVFSVLRLVLSGLLLRSPPSTGCTVFQQYLDLNEINGTSNVYPKKAINISGPVTSLWWLGYNEKDASNGHCGQTQGKWNTNFYCTVWAS